MQISNRTKQPYALLLATVLLLLFLLALKPLTELDFQDILMFGFPLGNMVWFIPFFLLGFWYLYLATSRLLYSRILTWVHVLTTVVSILLLLGLLYLVIAPTLDVTEHQRVIGHSVQFLTICFLVGQLVFLVNLGMGVVVKFKEPH